MGGSDKHITRYTYTVVEKYMICKLAHLGQIIDRSYRSHRSYRPYRLFSLQDLETPNADRSSIPDLHDLEQLTALKMYFHI